MRLKLTVYIGIVLGVLYLLPLAYPFVGYENLYLKALQPKIARAQSITSSKIILIGGSNLTFGIDSKRLEEAMHKPVCNMALSADMGLPMMLRMAAGVAKKGDIVLLSPEYLCRYEQPRTMALVDMVAPNARLFLNIDLGKHLMYQCQKAQITFLAFLRPLLEEAPLFEKYRAQDFDAWGDYTGHKGKGPMVYGEPPPIYPLEADLMSELASYCKAAKTKGVQVYYLPQSYPMRSFSENKVAIDGIVRVLQTQDISLLCSPEAMLFADAMIYDTPNHLTWAGRALRTERIIEALLQNEDSTF